MLAIPGHDIPDWASSIIDHPGGGAGIIHKLPDTLYHGTKALLGKGGLEIANTTGTKFKYWLDQPHLDDIDTEALLIGKAFHTAALEPDLFDKQYVEMPAFGDLRSSTNRDRKIQWLRNEGAGRIGLRNDQLIQIFGMAASVRRHSKLRKILQNGNAEVTALWVDPHTGLPLKSKMDWVSEISHIGFDLKSALSANKKQFKRAISQHNYHMQDALYTRAFEENNIEFDNFIFGVCEKEPPYDVAVYEIDAGDKVAGEQLYMTALTRVARWIEQNHFPGYSENIEQITLSQWDRNEAEELANSEPNQ